MIASFEFGTTTASLTLLAVGTIRSSSPVMTRIGMLKSLRWLVRPVSWLAIVKSHNALSQLSALKGLVYPSHVSWVILVGSCQAVLIRSNQLVSIERTNNGPRCCISGVLPRMLTHAGPPLS